MHNAFDFEVVDIGIATFHIDIDIEVVDIGIATFDIDIDACRSGHRGPSGA